MPLPLCLASGSVQRRQLLEQLGLDVAVQHAPDVDERCIPEEPIAHYVRRVARLKAEAGRRAFAEGCVVAADTALHIDGHIVGKPTDEEDAVATLMRLSGRTHRVVTAVCVAGPVGVLEAQVTTAVTFRTLSRREAQAYWQTGEPVGKAGGYALQGRGAQFVVYLAGSASAVIGLPLAETALLLRQQGLDPLIN